MKEALHLQRPCPAQDERLATARLPQKGHRGAGRWAVVYSLEWTRAVATRRLGEAQKCRNSHVRRQPDIRLSCVCMVCTDCPEEGGP